LLFSVIFLLAGCGGGGGGGGTITGGSNTVVLGTAVDQTGAPVPAATITVLDDTPRTASLSQGGFRLVGVSPGVHRLEASARVGGTTYTGSTQVLVPDNTTISNANIQLSPSGNQAILTGVVRDSSGNALNNARVFLGVFVTPSGSDVASLVGFTDSLGRYRIENIPVGPSRYTALASLLGFQNATQFVSTLMQGETRHMDFQLVATVGESALVPQNVSVQSFTQPSAAAQPNIGLKPGPAYEAVRRILSPAYARLSAGRHAAAHVKRLRARPHVTGFGPYAIEMDVFFDEGATDSLSGFRIYNSAGADALTPWDFLQDPLANIYRDLDPFYQADEQYNFAVSAINNDSAETGLSSVVSVLPLELLTVTQPTAGQTLTQPAQVFWNPVNGASSYSIFVYNQFPSIGVDPVVQAQNLSNAATSYTLPNSLASGDYWVIVAASADSGTEVSVSQIVKFHIQ
jgi:hypothetical protein